MTPKEMSKMYVLYAFGSALFSRLVFHEKLTKKAALGLAILVGGTLLMLF